MRPCWFSGELILKKRLGKRGKWNLLGSVYLVSAHTPEEAFDKFCEIGKTWRLSEQASCPSMECEFSGVGQMAPLYEKLEDGIEILETLSLQGSLKDVNDAVSTLIHSKDLLVANIWSAERNRIHHGIPPMFSEQ